MLIDFDAPIAAGYRHVCAMFSGCAAAFQPLFTARPVVGFDRFSGQRPHQPFLTFRPALSDIQPIYPPSLRRLFRACSLALSGRNKAISRRVYAVFIRAGLKVKAGWFR